jgi:glycosyltransferase involved in cell wall biosynthesis
VLVSDDASTDRTAELAGKWAIEHGGGRTLVRRQARNLGYGGNQKAVFAWAAEEGTEIAVLLHGDEQYPPEMIEDLVRPIVSGDASAVFGSRMIIRGGAREGGMPMARFVANKALSRMLNLLTPGDFSEWFSGFRAYRVPMLAEMGWDGLPDGFDFDTAITIRLVERGHKIAEIPIPTHYGDELSRVPLLRTGLATIRHGAQALRARGRAPERTDRPSAPSGTW